MKMKRCAFLTFVLTVFAFSVNAQVTTGIKVSTSTGGTLYLDNTEITNLWDNDSHTIPIEKPGTYTVKIKLANEKEISKTVVISSRGIVDISFLMPPSNVRFGTVRTNTLPVLWDSSGSGVRYNVYYHTENNIDSARVVRDITETNRTLTDLTFNRTYYVWVSVTENGMEGIKSAVISQALQSEPQIYIVGYEIVGRDDSKAVYWLNGVKNVLPTTPPKNSEAEGIGILGSNIYIVGWEGRDAVYWLNNRRIVLPNESGRAKALAITISGSDVYIAGFDGNDAVYWLNGIRIVLPKIGSSAYASAIAVSGSDVYIAGSDGDDAVYWLNDKQVVLPKQSVRANARAIAISGSDVYIAGSDGGHSINNAASYDAVYWQNERRIALPRQSVRAEAYAITVSGSDVYIAGRDGIFGNDGIDAVYWLNENRIVLPRQNREALENTIANAIAVSGSDVYIAGWDRRDAVYWLNDKRIVLQGGRSANGIAIIR